MSSPHNINQHKHRKIGCSSANATVTSSQTTAHRITFNWTAAAESYPNLEDAPSFITGHRQQTVPRVFTTTADPDNLQGTQLEVYTAVRDHFTNNSSTPLRLIITGTAGTGKSYLIQCLRLLLGDTLKVAAPTGVASFIIDGSTLHSLLHLPTRGEFKGKPSATASRNNVCHQVHMRCPWLVGKCLAKLTIVCDKPSPIMLNKCLADAPLCCLETLVNCHLSWTSPSTPQTHAQTSQTKAELPISILTRLSPSHASCIKLARIQIKYVSAASEKC